MSSYDSFPTPQQAPEVPYVGMLAQDAEFMGRQPGITFVPLGPGIEEVVIGNLQPIQTGGVNGPHLAALSRANAPLPPIIGVTHPDLPEGRLLLGDGTHRTYLGWHFGRLVVPAHIVHTEEDFWSFGNDALWAYGTLAKYRAQYTRHWEARLQTLGITTVADLWVDPNPRIHSAEAGLVWPPNER